MSKIAAATLVATILSFGGQAVAKPPVPKTDERVEVSRVVTVNRVDYRNPAQIEALYADLQRAAVHACMSPNADLSNREARAADRACAQRALGTAVASIDRPMLTARYQIQDAPILARGY